MTRLLRQLEDWIDERTTWRTGVSAWFDSSVPRGGGLAAALGASVVTCFVVLVVTGLVLMMGYAPSPQAAWASVHYVQFVQKGGWVLRGLHYWATQALFVLAALHIACVALVASPRRPREIGWWLGLLVLGLAVGEGITGGLLPWDQRGWWARVVEGNITGLAPGIGGFLEQMMSGGAELGALGLARAFTAHVLLLPLPIALALWVRHTLVRRHGWREPAHTGDVEPYLKMLARGVVVFVVVSLALFAVTGRFRAPLEAPADPLSDYPARPEWFLYTLFQLRKFFHGPAEFWGTTLIPGAAAGYLALFPFLDRSRRWHPVAVLPVLGIFGAAVWLGAMAMRHDAHDSQYLKARAKWDRHAEAVAKLALTGRPPGGPLELERHDPELRGRALFERHCANCHVLEELGDLKKATATKLDGWGTTAWIEAMIHDPDAPEFFGRGPYAEQMPSVEVRPKKKPPDEPWTPMVKNDAEKKAVALFLAAEGDEPGDPPRPALTAAVRAEGEKIVSERCTTCHLYKGEGDDEDNGLAPELSHYGSVDWTRTQVANPASPQTYRKKALDPELKKHMPRFDKDLSAEDIDIVARWTRTHGRSGSP
jgi:ubiquinol-cytochrome c reductase cytochrome b subunit